VIPFSSSRLIRGAKILRARRVCLFLFNGQYELAISRRVEGRLIESRLMECCGTNYQRSGTLDVRQGISGGC